MDAMIEVESLEVSYGDRSVLEGVDLVVPAGSVFALLGPNGAGKTTLVRVISTLLRPTAGTARVAGHDVVTEGQAVRRAISLTGQSATVDPVLTGRENLVLMARLSRLGRRGGSARAEELLAEFDLTQAAGRRVADYSGGMRRRLDLAAGLIRRPQVMFLDEPTTGLDLRSRQTLWDVVRRLVGEGVTVLLTTQYLEEADQLADSIAVLDGGRVVAQGTSSQLKEQVARQRIDLVLGSGELLTDARRVLGDQVVHLDEATRTVGVATDGGAARVREVLDLLAARDVEVDRLSLHTASLDDVFLTLTGHHAQTENPHPEQELETAS